MRVIRLQPTPDYLVENGEPRRGWFQRPFPHGNLVDAQLGPYALPRLARDFRLKEWVGFALTHSDLYLAVIIQNAKCVASANAYAVDRRNGRFWEWKIMAPPMLARLPESLFFSQSRIEWGRKRVVFDHRLDLGWHRLLVDIGGHGSTPPIWLDVRADQDMSRVDPLVVSLPIPPHHHTYTHKSPLSLSGVVRIGREEFHFEPDRHFGNLDEQKTFYPYRSRWKWACFVGRSGEGRVVMLNLADQMTARGEMTENAIWVDGRLEAIGESRLTPPSPGEPFWRMSDTLNRSDLLFKPSGSKVERMNLVAASVDYRQSYGHFNGVLTSEDGTTHRIENLFGVLEEMSARF